MLHPGCVLVVSLGGLGDFLTRWPLWQSLRRTYPSAIISFLGEPSHSRFLVAAGLCDDSLDFNERQWMGGNSLPAGRQANPKSQIPNKFQILNSKPTSAHGGANFKYELMISVLGRRGRDWAEKVLGGAGLVEFEPFPEKGSKLSVSEFIMAQAKSHGLADPGRLELRIPEDAGKSAGEQWDRLGLRGKDVIAINPGSGAKAKNWPRERFAAVSRRLGERGITALIFLGEAEDGDSADWGNGSVCIRDVGLMESAALLRRCLCYLGNDSGFSHLATLAGLPSTLIYGPTDPIIWRPSGENVTIVKSRIDCSPCVDWRSCRRRKCLEDISVEDVIRSIVVPGD